MESYSAFDAVPVPIFVVGQDGHETPTYRFANATCLALFGLQEHEMVGHSARDVFGRRLGEVVTQRHADVIATGRTLKDTITLLGPEGEVVIDSTLAASPERPGRLIGTNLPIARSRDLALEMTRSARNAERDTALAARALALRGPMRKYSMLIDELKSGFTDLGNGKVELIEEIGHLGEEAYGLVRQVLTYTRATAGQTPRPERLDLGTFCEKLFATLDPEGRQKLFVEPRGVLVERRLLWFVLHELLAQGLKGTAGHEFRIDCPGDAEGMLEVRLSCRPGPAASGDDEICDLDTIESVLRARGGRVTLSETSQGRICAITLPGRVLRDASPPGAGPGFGSGSGGRGEIGGPAPA